MSRHVDAKAARLLAAGAVEPDPAPVESFVVRGDTGSYHVVVGAQVRLCSCPAVGECSHVAAVLNEGGVYEMDERLWRAVRHDRGVDRERAVS